MAFRMGMLLLVAAATPAVAQTQLDMDMQADAAFKAADAKMNAAYKAAMASAKAQDKGPFYGGPKPNPGFADALLAAQRAWLVFRDAECRVEMYENWGGSVMPMVYSMCEQQLTEQRTKQIETGGDAAVGSGK